MTRYLIGGALASAAITLAGIHTPVAAQQPVCAPRAVLIAMLTKRYGERLRVIARENRGYVVELHTGPSGSWTLVFSRADGRSCAVAAGQRHRILPPAASGTDDAPSGKSDIPAPAPKPRDSQF